MSMSDRKGSIFLRPGNIFARLNDFKSVIFWMGDFNYRINLSNYEIRERIDQCDIEYLLSNDQLLVEKEKGSIFFGYEEGRIEFLPTYRINSATGYYDSGLVLEVPSFFTGIHDGTMAVNLNFLAFTPPQR